MLVSWDWRDAHPLSLRVKCLASTQASGNPYSHAVTDPCGVAHGPTHFPSVPLTLELRQEGLEARLDLCLKKQNKCFIFCY